MLTVFHRINPRLCGFRSWWKLIKIFQRASTRGKYKENRMCCLHKHQNLPGGLRNQLWACLLWHMLAWFIQQRYTGWITLSTSLLSTTYRSGSRARSSGKRYHRTIREARGWVEYARSHLLSTRHMFSLHSSRPRWSWVLSNDRLPTM